MATIITVTNQKGGVGKTTTAHALATGLSIKGNKTLAIDLDPQCNLSFTFGADMEETPSIYDVLKGNVSINSASQKLESGVVCASSLDLAGADMEFTKPGREYLLKKTLKPVMDIYDFIIIDTPPTLSILTINALTASNTVIIPAQANIYSLQGLARLYETIETVREYCNNDLSIGGILLTKYNNRTVLSRDLTDVLQEKAKALNTKVYKTTIREGIAIQEAQTMQKDIFNGGISKPAQDYLNFIDELLKDL